MRIPALKDSDGDYWIKFGMAGDEMACLSVGRKGDPTPGYIDSCGSVSSDVLATSNFGPFVAVYLDITEVEVPDISKVCDDCLYDKHFCYACDDAVSHGHVHTEG